MHEHRELSSLPPYTYQSFLSSFMVVYTYIHVHVHQNIHLTAYSVHTLCVSIIITNNNCFCLPQKSLYHVNRQVNISHQQQKLIELQSKIEYVGMDKTQHPIVKLYKVSCSQYDQTKGGGVYSYCITKPVVCGVSVAWD